MNLQTLPWLELAIGLPMIAALIVRFYANTETAWKVVVGITLTVFALALLAWYTALQGGCTASQQWQHQHFGRTIFQLDRLSGPLFCVVALLHALTILTTAKVKMNQLSFIGHLLGESIRLATFACIEPWPMIALLALGIVPPLLEMIQRKTPAWLFGIHMVCFVVLLAVGWYGVEMDTEWGAAVLLLAILLRSGTFPLHLWVTNLFENATFGTALLYVTPIAGMYAALRLVLPVAPDWVLQTIGLLSLFTTIYAASMAIVQNRARRFMAYFFLSHASVVLVGIELHTTMSLTGALFLWPSVALSLGGVGLMLRSLEARHGRLDLRKYHGLYAQSPALAVGYMLMGLGSVGFPGTLGFVAAEVLVDGAVSSHVFVGVTLILAAALNGIAVVRVYFLLFTGAQYQATIPAGITLRERWGVLVLCGLFLAGGLLPQIAVQYCHTTAESLEIQTRRAELHDE